ncbi:MAG: hypothetical protein Fur0037_28210 [Planctomycetota bacterium]
MRQTLRIASALLVSATLGSAFVSCGSRRSSGPKISAAAREEANKVFREICASCHGNTGDGDGPGSKTLDPKPRKFKDAKWQDSITDEQIKKTITNGGAAVGKSAQMPAQPQLKVKEDVLNGLVRIVRSFRAQ